MAEVLAEFEHELLIEGGSRYVARACGAAATDGRWQGWLEFVPLDGGEVLRTPRETTQPNRTDTIYWASGLTPVYLEGAFERALRPTVVRSPSVSSQPAYDEPANPFVEVDPEPTPATVLDPFSVYEKGEAVLRRQLDALSDWHLVNIIRAYALSHEDVATLSRQPHIALVERIVARVASARV